MMKKIGIAVLGLVWALVAVLAWFSPAKEQSDTERRRLAQLPELSAEALLSGSFAQDFESYTLDQFPARDTFRQLKALVHYGLLGQRDNNGIYITGGYAAELDYPLDTEAVTHAMDRLTWIYENYLSQSRIYCAVVPDKGYYLAQENGYPAMDYQALFTQVQQALPWATHIDLTDSLDISDYYFTDTHWRQEALLPAAQKLSQAMGVTQPQADSYTQTRLDRDFYGVYYGQAALSMEAEPMYILESDLLSRCRVYNYETGGYTAVYDMDKLTGKDLYEVYLSGSQSLLRIENPDAATRRELIVFRDSFGSSVVPLLVQDYAAVTLVDIRYISSQLLERYLEFDGQDVLFLYSTLVLNNGTSLK